MASLSMRTRVLAMRVVFVVAVAAVADSGCMGGCYVHAGTVEVVPAAPCLTLFGGQSATDDVVCAVPQLGGQNGCADALTLPAPPAGGAPVVVPAGAKIDYPVGGDARPGLTVTTAGGTTRYAISATLGAEAITITIPVH
jgi:hypothetical protein